MAIPEAATWIHPQVVAAQERAMQDARQKYRQAMRALRGSYRSSLNPRSRVQIAAWSLSGDQHADAYSRRYTRELARDLERNAGAFVTMFDVWVQSLVADGVRPRPTTASSDWNTRASEYIHEEYKRTQGGMDIREQCNMYGLQETITRSIGRDGDMAILKIFDGGRDTGRPCLQCFESEQIEYAASNAALTPDGLRGPHGTVGIIGGMALDVYGKVLAYYGCPYARGYNDLGGVALGEAKEYLADQMLFGRISKRYSQTRGMPLLVAVLDDFERIDSYMESEVIAAEQGSQIYGVLEYPPGMDPRPGRAPPSDEDQAGQGLDGGRNADGSIDWQPTSAGSMLQAPHGAKYQAVDPKRPNPNAEPFLITLLRQFCAVTGIPYEIVYNDLRGLSWSSARALISTARGRVRTWQTQLLAPIFSEIYLWKIGDAIARGKLPPIDGWRSHEHEWPELEWPDPLKEVQTNVAQYDFGMTSLSRIVGRSWKNILSEQAEEQQFRDQLNLQRWVALHQGVEAAKAQDPSLTVTVGELITLKGANSAPGAYLEAIARADQAETAANAPAPDAAPDTAPPRASARAPSQAASDV